MKILVALAVLLVVSLPAFAQEPKLHWFDDFMGFKIDPKYSLSFGGTGGAQLSGDARGGVLEIYCSPDGPGAARVRLGEEPGGSFFKVLNFSGRRNLSYKARIFLNSIDHIEATVGLVGVNDPENVLALLYRPEGGWFFQAINEKVNSTVPIGFVHAPGGYFTVRIETEWGETPTAKVFINDEAEPRATMSREFIPDALCTEFQLWNMRREDGTYSQPTLYVDYLSVMQDR